MYLWLVLSDNRTWRQLEPGSIISLASKLIGYTAILGTWTSWKWALLISSLSIASASFKMHMCLLLIHIYMLLLHITARVVFNLTYWSYAFLFFNLINFLHFASDSTAAKSAAAAGIYGAKVLHYNIWRGGAYGQPLLLSNEGQEC